MEQPAAQKAMEEVGAVVSEEAFSEAHGSKPTLINGIHGLYAYIFCPGILACLADTDSGCLIVAAQSGARYGYSLMLLQVALIPILFMAQELTVRLGIYTGHGHTACIRTAYGSFWAWFTSLPLVFQCIATMVSEMAGVASVGELWGLSQRSSTCIAAAVILMVALCFRYKQVEFIGVALGLFELAFVVTMFCYHPDPGDVFRGSVQWESDSTFMALVGANVGAVIMPWMIYFQQSAVVARGLRPSDLQTERKATLFGCILTQFVMIATMITLAAAKEVRGNVETVEDIAFAMEPAFGLTASKVIVSFAFVGGSLCAAFVLSVAASWALCEAGGWGTTESLSMNVPISKAKPFYASFVAVVVIGAIILVVTDDLVELMLAVVVTDSLLMPFTIGFLFLLATGKTLPEEVRVVGWRKAVLAIVFVAISIVCIGSTIWGFVPS